jgi:hypothetical protein|tara:strand:+ start:374 stop:484 length:111 start_codon:yes stop_codon:yes gene_type:complete
MIKSDGVYQALPFKVNLKPDTRAGIKNVEASIESLI